MGFNLDDYEPVAERVEKFWNDHPEGSITTEIVSSPVDGCVVVKAEVFYSGHRCTGHAMQELGLSGKSAEATAPLEVCETSAVGRALANAGYQTKGRASREEMAKAQPAPEPVDLLHLCQGMEADELQRFREALHMRWPGIGLRVVHPDLVRDVTDLAVSIVAERYAQPQEGTEPF